MSDPRKHHYTPRFLLRHFAGPDKRLLVYRVDSEKQYVASPADLGHVTDGHTRVRADGEKDRSTLEDRMSQLEGAVATAIRVIGKDNRLRLDADEFSVIAWFASLQLHRNRFLIGYLKQALEDGRSMTEISDVEVQSAILDVSVRPVLDAWEASLDPDSYYKDRYDTLAILLLGLRWDVLRYNTPSLLIGDGFAAQYGVRPEFSMNYDRTEKNFAKHGFLVPMHEAASFTIPLTPTLALHLHHGDSRRYLSSQRINQRTVFAARAFVAHPTDWTLPSKRVGAIADWLVTQRFVRQLAARNA